MSDNNHVSLAAAVAAFFAHPGLTGFAALGTFGLGAVGLVGTGVAVVFGAGAWSREPEIGRLEDKVEYYRDDRDNVRREGDATRTELKETVRQRDDNERWALEEKDRADAATRNEQTSRAERDVAIEQRDQARDAATGADERAEIAERQRDAATSRAVAAEREKDDAVASRDRAIAQWQAEQTAAREASRRLAEQDDRLKEAGEDREELLSKAWDALLGEAATGECLRLVRYGREVDCAQRTRGALAGYRSAFERCWLEGRSRPFYMAGVKTTTIDTLALEEGSVRFCDPRLVDRPSSE